MIENPFSERYRNHSNVALLKIIGNPYDYESLALEAAQRELAARNLSAEQLSIEKRKIEEEEFLKKSQREKIADATNEIKNKANSFVDFINPVQKESPSVDKQLMIFCIYLSAIFLYGIINNYSIFRYAIAEIFTDPSTLMFTLPYLALGTGTFLLWKRMKSGWYFIFVFLTHVVIQAALIITYDFFIFKPITVPAFQNLFKQAPILDYLLPLIFYGSGIYFLCRKPIRQFFEIKTQKIILIFSLLAVLNTLLMSSLLSFFH